MSNLNSWKSGTALLLMLGLTSGPVTQIVVPMLAPAPAVAQTNSGFSDVQSGYWAKNFIEALAARGVIKGYTDGSFKPENPVTRAEFAAMVQGAFNKPKVRDAINFVDVKSNFWATSAIQKAYEIGFLSGYTGNYFRPEVNIPREQVLVSLANGLNYSTSNSVATDLQVYNDASAISDYARSSIAAATEKRIAVNYPNVQYLNPGKNATRAEVAAFIYQALVSSGEVAAINSPYIVAVETTVPKVTRLAIPAGTAIPVRYESQKILVTPDEKAPVTLTVASNVTTSDGTVLIPAGTKVAGQLQPAQGGSQFVAQQLVMANGQRMDITAASQVISKTEEVKKGASATTVVKGAVLGSAAAAGISAVTGNREVSAWKVLTGTAAGSLLSLFLGRDSVKLIAVEPNTDLNLTLGQDLVFTSNNQ